jgi:hypothetical protein
MRATPESTAALATAGATVVSTRGSNGLGMMYSRPKWNSCPPYAALTLSGTSCRASAASACEAASFISSLIDFARTSSAPRKMPGNPRRLFTWLG